MSRNILVEFKDVKKTYQLGEWIVNALNGCSFEIHKGEMVSILGPSGSGKTTLLNICGGLDRPDSGLVIVDNQEISSLNKNARAEMRKNHIGFVFQFFQLFNHLSAAENIEYPLLIARQKRQYRRKRVIELLELVDLSDRGHHKPNQLSGGERQRVAIARALTNNPELVLADEPTGNLDSKTGKMIMELLIEINEEFGTTFIIVTHDTALSNACDCRFHLIDGQITPKVEKQAETT